jgi:hypothetical protein
MHDGNQMKKGFLHENEFLGDGQLSHVSFISVHDFALLTSAVLQDQRDGRANDCTD